jgi:acyl transferase domain-containing protein
VVLEQAPASLAPGDLARPHVLTLSARDAAALSDLAGRVDAFL